RSAGEEGEAGAGDEVVEEPFDGACVAVGLEVDVAVVEGEAREIARARRRAEEEVGEARVGIDRDHGRRYRVAAGRQGGDGENGSRLRTKPVTPVKILGWFTAWRQGRQVAAARLLRLTWVRTPKPPGSLDSTAVLVPGEIEQKVLDRDTAVRYRGSEDIADEVRPDITRLVEVKEIQKVLDRHGSVAGASP